MALRQAVLGDEALLRRVLQVCIPQVGDPWALRYHFWKHYAQTTPGMIGSGCVTCAVRLFDGLCDAVQTDHGRGRDEGDCI